MCMLSNGGGMSLYWSDFAFTGISLRSAWARPASDRTQSNSIEFSVQMAMTARARPSSVMITLRNCSPLFRLVSHQTEKPSASR